MIEIVEHLAHADNIRRDTRRRLVVSDEHGLDFVLLIRGLTCRYWSSGRPWPHSTRTASTSRQKRWQRSTHNSENWPKTEASTLSPGDSVLAMADSQPPVPEPGNRKTWPLSVWKIFFRSAKSGSVNFGKSGAR